MSRASAWTPALLVIGGIACGGSSPPTSPSGSTTVLRGTVTDPAGDPFTVPPSLGISPDLVAATVEVSDGNLILTVSFAPGTLSSRSMFYAILDTDEDPTTGRPGLPAPGLVGGIGDKDLIGGDYEIIGGDSLTSPNHASIYQLTAPPAQNTLIGTGTWTSPSADTARITVPLSMLGHDDGQMKVKIYSQLLLSDQSTTLLALGTILDYMPNLGEPPGLVR